MFVLCLKVVQEHVNKVEAMDYVEAAFTPKVSGSIPRSVSPNLPAKHTYSR